MNVYNQFFLFYYINLQILPGVRKIIGPYLTNYSTALF